ncbi:MAG: TIGR03084 family protein [Nocardiopsaceae bacterium]|nr:TIGR03084 family protein [Nocardiopsaceae bacterium]
MPVDIASLTADLGAESAALDELVTGLGPAGWAKPTPASGWTVRDQIAHLAYFDEATVLAVTEPETFRAEARDLLAGGDDFVDRITAAYRHVTDGHVAVWYRAARRELLAVLGAAPPGAPSTGPVPWFGPDMSLASTVTARIMETWAHGQDIADALGVTRRPTAVLRHIAHLGVRTAAFSFTNRGRPAPGVPVRVELDGPDGERWTWGPAEAANTVRGDALDFCLAVTQRRHRDELGLRVTGPVADAWMSIAQAYAGPPGPGRPGPGSGRAGPGPGWAGPGPGWAGM